MASAGDFANEFSPQSDVWTFAATSWEILNECKAEPFNAIPDYEIEKEAEWVRNLRAGSDAQKGKFFLGSTLPADCPAALRALLCECWRYEPADRPSMAKVVQAVHFNPCACVLSDKCVALQLEAML